MLKGIEFQGRLARRDGRPANPGTYQIRFALHADAVTRRGSWTEDHHDVAVAPGGNFAVILGLHTPLKGSHFKGSPRWLSVRVVRRGEVAEETSPRVPLTGAGILVAETLEKFAKRLERLEEAHDTLKSRPSTLDLLERTTGLEVRVTSLDQGEIPRIGRRIGTLAQRLDKVDGDDGRLERLEDRLDDIDGPDGDIIDLNERMDTLENHTP